MSGGSRKRAVSGACAKRAADSAGPCRGYADPAPSPRWLPNSCASRIFSCLSLLHYFVISLLLDEPRNHIVHGDRPNRAILLTHHRERAQVVLVKQFEYVALIGVGGDAEQRFELQLRQALLRCGQEQPSHRDRPA